jgi:hypothetical protein
VEKGDAASGGDRGFVAWDPRSTSKLLVEHILTLINNYKRAGLPAPTVRDLYYDLLAQYGKEAGYVKSTSFQRKVYRILTKMRRSKMIRFSDINDDSFDSLVRRTFEDPAGFWEDVKGRAETYAKDLTVNQPARVVVFTEGAGMVRQFHTVARDYTIPVYSPGGWDSITLKHTTAARAVREFEATERQTVVLHTGDLDPDGVALFEAFAQDVEAFIEDYGYEPEEVIRFRRVMILPEQAALLPASGRTPFSKAEIKEKNYRGQRWPLDYKAELQALPMQVRLRLMREAIESELDLDQLQEDREAHEGEYEEINDTVTKLRLEGSDDYDDMEE